MNSIMLNARGGEKTQGTLFQVGFSQHKSRHNYTVTKELVKPPTKLMTNMVRRLRERKRK